MKTYQTRLFEMIPKVQQWFIVRNLENDDPKEQLMKLLEEMLELVEGINKSQLENIKDAIGDCLVVIIGFCLQTRTDIHEAFTIRGGKFGVDQTDVIFEITSYLKPLSDGVQGLQLYTVQKQRERHIQYIIDGLDTIALQNGLDLVDCLEYVYDVIKDRPGKKVNGKWVKESDLEEGTKLDDLIVA